MAFAPNPNYDWTRFAGNALQDIGVGMTQAPTLATGFGRGAQINQAQQPYRDQMATLEEERKREALEKNQTSEWVKANFPQYSNLPPAQAWTAAMADLTAKRNAASGDNLTTDQRNWQYGQANPGFMDFLNGGQGDVTTGLTPIPGNMDGKTVWALPGNDGRYYIDGQPTEAGKFEPTNPFDLNAQKSGGRKFGEQTGDAQFDLPSAKLTVDQTIDALNEIRANPEGMAENFGNILGLPTQMVPARPGTKMADFRNSVSRGANLAFMQAREMLRGGGQITDFESKKAESAITDMQIAMESGSQAMFEKALNDFEQAVKDGYSKLQSQASVMPGYGAGQPASAAPAGPDYKNKYGLE